MLLGLESKLLVCRDSLKKKTLSCGTVNLLTHLNKCRMIPCFKVCIECLSQPTCKINRKLQSYGFVCFNGQVTLLKFTFNNKLKLMEGKTTGKNDLLFTIILYFQPSVSMCSVLL